MKNSVKSIDLVVAHQIVVFSFTRVPIHIKSATLLELCFPKKLSERKLLNEEKLFSRNLKMRPSLKIPKKKILNGIMAVFLVEVCKDTHKIQYNYFLHTITEGERDAKCLTIF